MFSARQARGSVIWMELERESSRVLRTGFEVRGGMGQAGGDLGFEGFEQGDVGVGVEAADAGPVAGEAEVGGGGGSGCAAADFAQQDADVGELAAHGIGHVADEGEGALEAGGRMGSWFFSSRVLSSQFSVLSSQFSVLSSQFSVLSSQFSVSQFSVLSSNVAI